MSHVVKPSPRHRARLELHARQNRSNLNRPEALLWAELRGYRLGVYFRRQVVLADRYIVDFAAPAARLVVEVDGATHRVKRRADARRDRELAALGWRVLRVEAAVVLRDVAAAVAAVRAALASG